MIVRCDMAVNIERSAFAAQRVAFISVEVEVAAGVLRNPRYVNHHLPANGLSVLSATC